MNGGRELDAKVTAPLFPRLHVNDAASKLGPRAPPRNKMALYEQLSIPSSVHRFREHAAVSVALAVPVPQHGPSADGGGGTVPFGSQGGGRTHEKDVFLPCYLQKPAPPNDDIQSPSPTTTNDKTLRTSSAIPSPESATPTFPGVSQSADRDDLPAVRNSCKSNPGNEDDFMVPTFFHSVAAQLSVKDPPSTGRCFSATECEKENAIPTCSQSNQNQKVRGLPQGQLPGDIFRSKKSESIHTLLNAKAIETVEPPIENNVIEGLVAEGTTGETSRMLKPFSSLNGSSTLAGPEKSVKGRVLIHPQSNGNCDADAARVHSVNDASTKAGTIWPNGGKLPSRTDYDTPCTAMDQDDSECAATEELKENDEDSETSELDSEPSFDISPDDIVGTIGPKHFWKARRAIANQQRVFAVQVFELHRLIKVQKLIAASPQLLVEGSPCFIRSQKVTSKKQPFIKDSEQTTRKDDSQKENRNGRKPETMRLPQHPPEISHKRPFGEFLQNGPHSGGNSSLFHMGSEGRPPGPWCLPPSGSQWLVPVMSPSEGLIYKPYVGPCPPSGAFMAPFVGGCGPFVAAPPVGDCVSPPFMAPFPSPLQQPSVGFTGSPAAASSYFPASYGFPVADNQLISPLATEQLILPRGNSAEHSQSLNSDNMSNHQSEAASGHRANGGQNDFHTSTASSPNLRAQEGAGLSPRFVMLPPTSEGHAATMHVHDSDSVPRVIKVVPHNRRTATESAARIFQFIQEERQHHEPI